MSKLDIIAGTVLFAALGLLCLVDLTAIWVRPQLLAVGGFLLWVFLLAALVVYASYCMLQICSFSNRAGYGWVTFCTLIVLIAIFSLETVDERSLSHEATQQVGCTIRQLFEKDSDLGLWRSCHLGHFTRQYYLFALPTLVTGQSQLALNFGGMLYLIMGLVVFAWGALNRLPQSLSADLAVAMLLVVPLHWHYFNWAVLVFDESNFPCAIGFIFVGLVLALDRQIQEKRPILVFCALTAFCLVLSAYAYTPALAIFCLGLIWLPLLMRRQFGWKAGAALFVLLAVSGTVAAVLTGDLKLDPPSGTSVSASAFVVERLLRGFHHLLFDSLHPPGTSYFFRILFIAAVILSLTAPKRLALLAWCLLTIVIAFVSRGYAMPPVEFGLHRATVMIPIFLYVLLEIARKWMPLRSGWIVILMFLALGGISASGLQRLYAFQGTRPIDQDLKFIQVLREESFQGRLPHGLVVLVGHNLGSRFLPVCDALNYFAADCQVALLDRGCRLPEAPLFREMQRITILSPGDPCVSLFQQAKIEASALYLWNNQEAFIFKAAPPHFRPDSDT